VGAAMSRPKFYKVFLRKVVNGKKNKRRQLVAMFLSNADADNWAEEVRDANPTWIVEVIQ
jgi:hypothetical protein